MKNQKTLIMLYGFAGVGKTTIAKRYKDSHPLSLCIEGDQLISMIGGWQQNEHNARACVFELTKSMASTHLNNAEIVMIPYLLVDHLHASSFEQIARKHNARFVEVYLYIPKEEGVKRLLERGSWGEEGLAPLTKKDSPEIEGLYILMENAMGERKAVKKIVPIKGDIDNTYAQFLEALNN